MRQAIAVYNLIYLFFLQSLENNFILFFLWLSKKLLKFYFPSNTSSIMKTSEKFKIFSAKQAPCI